MRKNASSILACINRSVGVGRSQDFNVSFVLLKVQLCSRVTRKGGQQLKQKSEKTEKNGLTHTWPRFYGEPELDQVTETRGGVQILEEKLHQTSNETTSSCSKDGREKLLYGRGGGANEAQVWDIGSLTGEVMAGHRQTQIY